MSIHGNGVRTHVQEFPISNNHRQNLVPPFIIREEGLVFKDTEKIHAMDSSVDYQSIYYPNLVIHIKMFLHSVFSYLSMSTLAIL